MDLYLSATAAVEITKLNISLVEELLREVRDHARIGKPMRLILSTPNIWFQSFRNERPSIRLVAIAPSALARESQLRRAADENESEGDSTGPIPLQTASALQLQDIAKRFALMHRA